MSHDGVINGYINNAAFAHFALMGAAKINYLHKQNKIQYSQTCVNRSPLGPRKKWPYMTDDLI
jgi:hypothetical protein